MRYGVVIPGGTAPQQLELAELADGSGWDGVFVWEAAYGVDAWSLLAAIAVRTARVRLGTMLTPLPWRRPWKVASQVATIDQLSGGRVVLAVGIGALSPDLPLTGEATGVRERAEMMDEGIDLMRTVWSTGGSYDGRFYTYSPGDRPDLTEMAQPAQERIPIWVVGVWPRMKSMRRVLRCDGVVAQFSEDAGEPAPSGAAEVSAWLRAQGKPAIDVVIDGESDPSSATATVRPWAEAGCTWWLETRWEMPHHSAERLAQIRERIEAGPPR